MSCQEAHFDSVMVKNTFIDFERTVEEPKRRRNQSLPPLKFSAFATSFQSLETLKLKDVKEIKEALTPTTCPSENGDDAAESEISFAEIQARAPLLKCLEAWDL